MSLCPNTLSSNHLTSIIHTFHIFFILFFFPFFLLVFIAKKAKKKKKMSQQQNKAWILKHGFIGFPTQDNFEINNVPYQNEPQDGEYILELTSISVDPHLRARFTNLQLKNHLIQTYAVGQVIASKNDKYPIGTKLTGILPAQLYVLTNCDDLQPVDVQFSDSVHVGMLGMPGVQQHSVWLVNK